MTQTPPANATPAAQPVQPMGLDDAVGFVNQRVFYPVFFHKLAAAGIRAETEDEQYQLLVMGAQLAEIEQSRAQEKRAAAATNDIAAAYADLQHQIGNVGGQPVHPLYSQIRKEAADHAQDPDVARAILSLQYHSDVAARGAA